MLLEDRLIAKLSEADAAELAREVYGWEASAKILPGEYDDNFQLASEDGRNFILKIMHPARERAFIDLQCRALEHLAARAPQLELPRVVPGRNREWIKQWRAPDGSLRLVWCLGFIPGNLLAHVKPHSSELLSELGRFLGHVDEALADFLHPGLDRELKWDLARASWVRDYLHHIEDRSRRDLVEKFLSLYQAEVLPALSGLRRSAIYGDANDYNVLVSDPWPPPRRIAGLIDFGDLHHSITVSELAIAAAYAILDKKDPLSAAAAVVRGYHAVFPLEESEIALLHALVGMRLAISVTNSAYRKTLKPDDPYVVISEEPAWRALKLWSQIHARFAHYVFREACGLPPLPGSEKLSQLLRAHASKFASLLDLDLRTAQHLVLDLSVGSTFLGADPRAAETEVLTSKIFEEMRRAGVSVAFGRYAEPRLLYASPLFGDSPNPTDERRTIHLGIDVFLEPGTALRAPLDGTVEALADRPAAFDYGPVAMLRHQAEEGRAFFTLYGHLSREVLTRLKPGDQVRRGEVFARIGGPEENGGWPPHLHLQIILDPLDQGIDFPGVASASQRVVWMALSPDPNTLLGISGLLPGEGKFETTLTARKTWLGRNLSLSYRQPLKIVRGWMQYLYDHQARAYLDVFNNVPLVGHSHPRVVKAAQAQLALLNTNTRYLHDNINRYAERLLELVPEPLRACYFVNSGSEANELALRLARTHTGRKDVIVLEHAYHGHTNTLVDISPHKFDGPGGGGRKSWVHVATLPDDYRGPYRRQDSQAGNKYAAHIAEILEELKAQGRAAAAFIAESLPSVAGQIVFPPGYLPTAYGYIRAAGAVAIADEVQVGFGRLGTHFWGFEAQQVVPDIVVLGKPIANGFPLAAVLTTAEIAQSFDNGMEFFSTFGGNPVACSAGLAVLDVLRDEGLQENARRVGDHLITRLQELKARHALIGDVRGSGLFLGLDLVQDPQSREPATQHTDYVVNRLRECGILAGSDGPAQNVIKLRPPLIFSESDAELLVSTLDDILQEDAAQVGK